MLTHDVQENNHGVYDQKETRETQKRLDTHQIKLNQSAWDQVLTINWGYELWVISKCPAPDHQGNHSLSCKTRGNASWGWITLCRIISQVSRMSSYWTTYYFKAWHGCHEHTFDNCQSLWMDVDAWQKLLARKRTVSLMCQETESATSAKYVSLIRRLT